MDRNVMSGFSRNLIVMVMKFRRCIEEFIRTVYTSKSLLRAGGFNLLCRTVYRRQFRNCFISFQQRCQRRSRSLPLHPDDSQG